ncbi:Protein GrpE [Planctomycetes bacterium Pan216]|uniref:Protein GrpE n=1 Tax=Kolteria novifilia TaxID=2527975 RepID=A0A518B4N7_9BACT|nr:Protein GrpE [Planctomycetes bacterium Pan216]
MTEEAPPEFGLVDVVEAFTAMRHEWRGQTRESREVAQSLHAAVTSIQDLETRLLAHAAEASTDESRKLAVLIAETDQQVTRSLAAAEKGEANRQHGAEADADAITDYFEQMNAVARWFARPLLTFVIERFQASDATNEKTTVEGLCLVLARLRRAMKELGIERIETLGQPFDANSMQAIGSLDSEDYPSGHVAEEISPCYRWRGQILLFANVRVSAAR